MEKTRVRSTSKARVASEVRKMSSGILGSGFIIRLQTAIIVPERGRFAIRDREVWVMVFKDRKDAGKRLAGKLAQYGDRADVIVLGLPRGGVTVAYEIAKALHCPLDILIVRKIGFPDDPELAVGAVSETGSVVINEDIVSRY